MLAAGTQFEFETSFRGSADYVRWLQNSLNKVMGTRLVPDGKFGPATRDALRRFQASRRLTVDGKPGPQTDAALVAAGAPRFPGGGGAQPAPPGIPALLGRETTAASQTIYLDIRLGSESPGRPMTGVFIPANYRAQQRVDLILYLHGFKRGRPSLTIDGYWNIQRGPHWPLREKLNESGRSAILVAPTLGPRSETGNLTAPGGFDRYLEQVMRGLANYVPAATGGAVPQIGSIILSCHSGGGYPMRRLATSSDRAASLVRECWGFDCVYSSADPELWARWARARPDARLFVYYLGSTQTLSLKLKGYGVPNILVQRSTAPNHDKVPITHWLDRLQNASVLR
jgi:peptidoglycan hydrolase-like protein with peptidoglycan-binding domain